jgi:folate-binding Fe-S cluster repair protein YgfZ
LLVSAQGGCALPHLGILHAQGADAANFLHNQLSNDFLLLPPDQAHLAAFCNAKGRMQASFIGFKTSPEDVWLVLRQDLLAQTLKRLRMFVLRAKVVINDIDEAPAKETIAAIEKMLAEPAPAAKESTPATPTKPADSAAPAAPAIPAQPK